ncbi:MAG TPA: hypothetical protein VFB28_01005 [Terriglobales bacterium]|nr:hypothetical protein [Terriglobales bacterium]
MNRAKDALLSYIETQKTIDRDQYQRLLARYKKAQAAFMNALAERGE